jgi:hypothetical protein
MDVVAIICQLTIVAVTHAPMDGVQNVLVRHCEYTCSDGDKVRHQIYYDDRCPKRIYKDMRSLYYGSAKWLKRL